MRVWGLLSLIIFLFPACSGTKRTSIRHKKSSAYKRVHRALTNPIGEQEAKLVDVPLPIDASPHPLHLSENKSQQNMQGIMLGYTSNLAPISLATFYMHEMERLGWQQVAYIDGVEKLLIFSKPGKICTISLRSVRKRVDLIIIVAPMLS